MNNISINTRVLPALTTALIVGLSLSGAAQATLINRGGGLIYDSTLNVTWLQNADLAGDDNFGVSGISSFGAMSWNTANQWIGAINKADYLGYSDWRLPTTAPVNGSTFNHTFSYNGSTDYGYSISAPGTVYAGSKGSEMAYLFYNELGGKAEFDTSGTFQGTLAVTGPFLNVSSSAYWSGTEYAPGSGSAWDFNTGIGLQGALDKGLGLYAWAVRPGDVPAVPEADTWALLLAGLGLMGVVAKQADFTNQLNLFDF